MKCTRSVDSASRIGSFRGFLFQPFSAKRFSIANCYRCCHATTAQVGWVDPWPPRTGVRPPCPRWGVPRRSNSAEGSVEGATPGSEESGGDSDESEKRAAA